MAEITLTYGELAKRLGIKIDSARRLVRRKHWKRTVGNDGTMRITVPIDALKDDKTPDNPTDSPPLPNPDYEIKIARLEAEVTGLNQLVDAERRRADAAEQDRDNWKNFAHRPWWKRLAGS